MSKTAMLNAAGVFIVLVLFSAVCHGQDEFDFRHTHWGESKENVKKSEEGNKVVYDGDNIFVTKDTIDGLDCEVVYLFIDDKLVRTKYMIKEKYSNKNMYIAKYDDLVSLLSKKYGKGKKTSIISDQYKRKGADLGVGIGVGKVHFATEWKNKKSEIDVVLTGNNFDITLVIEYESTEFAPLEAAKKQKKTLEKL